MKELARASGMSQKIRGDIATLVAGLTQLHTDLEVIYPMLAAVHHETVSGNPMPDPDLSKKTKK